MYFFPFPLQTLRIAGFIKIQGGAVTILSTSDKIHKNEVKKSKTAANFAVLSLQ